MSRSTNDADEHRKRIAFWVAREILPHERRIRAWLRRSSVDEEEADELLQEAYCRLSNLESIGHIGSPYAYFFSIVRNLLILDLRRKRVVTLETIAKIEAFVDDRPSPEQSAGAMLAYGKMLDMIAGLPERCRSIVQLRKLEGWSQKRIAEHFGTTEKAVEKQVWLGIRSIREAWGDAEKAAADRIESAESRGAPRE